MGDGLHYCGMKRRVHNLLKKIRLFQAKTIQQILYCLREAKRRKEVKTVTHFSHFPSKIVLRVGKAVESPLTLVYSII